MGVLRCLFGKTCYYNSTIGFSEGQIGGTVGDEEISNLLVVDLEVGNCRFVIQESEISEDVTSGSSDPRSRDTSQVISSFFSSIRLKRACMRRNIIPGSVAEPDIVCVFPQPVA
jgi:hypothetical protein